MKKPNSPEPINNSPEQWNIAFQLRALAQLRGNHDAVICPQKKWFRTQYNNKTLSYGALEALSNRYANGLKRLGVKRNRKILLFVKPSIPFFGLTYAVMKLGATAVMIDPAMGRANLLNAIKLVQPEAMIALPTVHWGRLLFKEAFSSIKILVSTGKVPIKGVHCLEDFSQDSDVSCDIADVGPTDLAAIAFTSGGTGKPKGVEITHQIFNHQIKIISNTFGLGAKDVDCPGFPLFALFSVVMGVKTCVPDMDPRAPAKVVPQRLVQNILDNGVTFAAGSPAIWERVADYCLAKKITLPSVKYVVMFGAPVAPELHEKYKIVAPNGTTYTPYGATESLPVTNICGEQLLNDTNTFTKMGKGTCVGAPVDGIEMKIIAVSEAPIASLNDAKPLPTGEVGEIIVSGPIVSQSYYRMDEENKKGKILEGDTIWHRMGDMGYFDQQGKLWFCGRKVHRVNTAKETLYSVQCEAIFNQHPQVKRSALIGVEQQGNIIPSLAIQRRDGQTQLNDHELALFKSELNTLGEAYPHTQGINQFHLFNDFPVDVRHNIKIDRIKLKHQVEQTAA